MAVNSQWTSSRDEAGTPFCLCSCDWFVWHMVQHSTLLYFQVEYKCKLESKKQAQEAAAAEEKARAARLDKLRELVAPHVEASMRLVGLASSS